MSDYEVMGLYKVTGVDTSSGPIKVYPQDCIVERKKGKYVAIIDKEELPLDFKESGVVHFPEDRNVFPVSRIDRRRKEVFITVH